MYIFVFVHVYVYLYMHVPANVGVYVHTARHTVVVDDVLLALMVGSEREF